MFGTVARMKAKPGMEAQLLEHLREYEALRIPGQIVTYLYRMDADPNEYYLAAVFDSRESYTANASNPEQEARYRRLLALLDGEPEWHDGAVTKIPAQG